MFLKLNIRRILYDKNILENGTTKELLFLIMVSTMKHLNAMILH